MFDLNQLLTEIDPKSGIITGASVSQRYLSDLRGIFADSAAYDAVLATDNPLIYQVSSVESPVIEGQLHYGLGMIMPGRIGAEFYMTKGHLHLQRTAAEVYVGLRGEGFLLLEHEHTGESQALPLTENRIVYVPGSTAHRTINTSATPLLYLGIYPAQAGHDYGAIAERNFRDVIMDIDGKPTVITRSDYLVKLRNHAS